MGARGAVLAGILERREAAALASVRRIALEPSVFRAQDPTFAEPARRILTREIDAQLCFELSKWYEIVETQPDATVRAAITHVRPTGRAASFASAAASFFIPGPIGVRAPGTTGALGAEAELVAADGRQLAAITWNRSAKVVGIDDPSLSRIGDALQLAEPFGDAAARALKPSDTKRRRIEKPDPCAAYGPRFRPAGFLAGILTNLYIPEMNSARPAPVAP